MVMRALFIFYFNISLISKQELFSLIILILFIIISCFIWCVQLTLTLIAEKN